jgi:hypothetical protein
LILQLNTNCPGLLRSYEFFTDHPQNGMVELSPAYDLVNTTIVLCRAQEELALPLKGKKKNLTKDDLVRYYTC